MLGKSRKISPEEGLHSESGAFAPPQDIYHCTSVPCSLNENKKHPEKIRKPKLPVQVRYVIANSKNVNQKNMMSQNFDSDGILPACEWQFYSCPGSTSSEGFAPWRQRGWTWQGVSKFFFSPTQSDFTKARCPRFAS